MITRERVFELQLDAIHYVVAGTRRESSVPTQKHIEVLESCDGNGRFRVGELSGRVTRIFFQGLGTIPLSERTDYLFRLDSYEQSERVSYSFRQWVQEERPMSLRLERTHKYTKAS